jgi:hypothetical protein
MLHHILKIHQNSSKYLTTRLTNTNTEMHATTKITTTKITTTKMTTTIQ